MHGFQPLDFATGQDRPADQESYDQSPFAQVSLCSKGASYHHAWIDTLCSAVRDHSLVIDVGLSNRPGLNDPKFAGMVLPLLFPGVGHSPTTNHF